METDRTKGPWLELDAARLRNLRPLDPAQAQAAVDVWCDAWHGRPASEGEAGPNGEGRA